MCLSPPWLEYRRWRSPRHRPVWHGGSLDLPHPSRLYGRPHHRRSGVGSRRAIDGEQGGRASAMRRGVQTLSAAEARRIALAAQGFDGSRREARPTRRKLLHALQRLGLLQIDSVNVLVRSHYLPLFSRLGPYDTANLDAAAYAGRQRALFEYWGHQASLLPLALHPLLRWRMARAEQGLGLYRSLAQLGRRRRAYVDAILAEVAERGPLTASELSQGGRGRGSWWGWSQGKAALEWLFWSGRVTTATRRRFERVYDLSERVLPPEVLSASTPTEEDAHRSLVALAARALGVATARDVRDYFRLDAADANPRLAELVEAGELTPVRVEGWKDTAYLDRRARLPRAADARALLSPFDSLVWERQRTERLFGFHYRISLYTPAHLRSHGYYVLPFLLGDQLVARADLKADRAARALRVPAAHAEEGADRRHVAPALIEELRAMAAWLGLERVETSARGGLLRARRYPV